MANYAVQEIVETGLNPTLQAAVAAGDDYLNDDRTFLVVKNAGGSAINVTITVQQPNFDIPGFGKVTFAAIVVSVPATTGERWIKAPKAPYTDANGKVQVTYSVDTSVTAGAVRMPGG